MSSTKFPAYDDSIMDTFDSPTNKLIDQVIRTPGREPSPQPTHFSLPYKNGNGNGHRVLRSATVGYIAPEFTGKKAQQTQGESFLCMWGRGWKLTLQSAGKVGASILDT